MSHNPTNANTPATTDLEAKLLLLESDLTTRIIHIELTLGMNITDINAETSRQLTQYEAIQLEFKLNDTNNQLINISQKIEILELEFATNITNYQFELKKFEMVQEMHQANFQELSNAVHDNTLNVSNLMKLYVEEQNKVNNLSFFIEGLDLDVNMNFVSVQNFTVELSKIYGDIQRETFINEMHDLAISNLNTNNSVLANMTLSQESRIAQLEIFRATDYDAIQLSEVKITELADNLTQVSSVTRIHRDSILEITTSVMKLESEIIAQNTSILDIRDRINQIELNVDDDRSARQIQDLRLATVEINVMTQNNSLLNHSSRLEELESDSVRDQYTITNHTLRILQLELLTNETQSKVTDIGTNLTKLLGNAMSCVMGIQTMSFLNRSDKN